MKSMYLRKNRRGVIVETSDESMERVAMAISSHDEHPVECYDLMLAGMREYRVVPNRPAWFGGGRGPGMLSACTFYQMADSLIKGENSIANTLRAIMATQQAGSGVGISVQDLRPEGSIISKSGGRASGPCSFLLGINTLLGTVTQGGFVQGANNVSVMIHNMEIERFIDLKLDENALDQYNTNIQLTDDFMNAAYGGRDFILRWRDTTRVVNARDLLKKVAHAMWVNGGVGVQFYDTAQNGNVLKYYGELKGTNPCGEFWLFDGESCAIVYINWSEFVRSDRIDWIGLKDAARLAARIGDNMIRANRFLPEVPRLKRMANLTRRMGVSPAALADALLILGLPYNSPEGRGTASQIMEWINIWAMRESAAMSHSRGSFPLFEYSTYARGEWSPPTPTTDHGAGHAHPPASWPDPRAGMRNCGVTAIAPGSWAHEFFTETEAYGHEPIFAAEYTRSGETYMSRWADDAAFASALEISWEDHIDMVAGLMPFVTEAASKTVNLPNDATEIDVWQIIFDAWRKKLKGVTAYRTRSRDKEVMCPSCQVVPPPD